MNTRKALSLIPLPRLNGALQSLGFPAHAVKADAIDVLEKFVEQGMVSLETISNSPMVTGDSTAPAPVLNIDKALQPLKDGLSSLELGSRAKLSEFDKALEKLNLKVNGIKTDPVDAAIVESTVVTTVSKLFDQFRKTQPVEVLEEVAASLPSFREERAGDLFPVTSYGKVDFSDMLVQVWDDPHCPAVVDDYVFDPEHLHQALVALSDRLPDNVWLAGERGTGKTEFVTQVAARLKRRLFRVNFDEAMERADYIGSNSVKDGTVFWKDGIVSQAIKHPGSIVLLDELGFARATNLAAFHSLCERSPHRALTIAETGERVPVASHVAFFVCDNSNGHGDEGGYFAGVREQNSAFIDRFSYTLWFDYLPTDKERQLLIDRTEIDPVVADQMVRFAGAAREKAKSGVLTQPPSLRQLFAWARAVKRGIPIKTAFQNAIVNKFPKEVEGELVGIYFVHVEGN